MMAVIGVLAVAALVAGFGLLVLVGIDERKQRRG